MSTTESVYTFCFLICRDSDVALHYFRCAGFFFRFAVSCRLLLCSDARPYCPLLSSPNILNKVPCSLFVNIMENLYFFFKKILEKFGGY